MRDEWQTRALFDDWAASYDADLLAADGPLSGYQATLQTAAQLVPVRPGARILDIGIGTGAFAALLAAHGVEITGLDPSSEMLARCRARYPEFELHHGSFADLSAARGLFDGVVSTFAWHESAAGERGELLRAMASLLKTDGFLCLADIMFASSAAVADARHTLGRLWDSAEVYALVSELDEQLRAAGLRPLHWLQNGPWHWIVLAVPLATLTDARTRTTARQSIRADRPGGSRAVASIRLNG
jgi:cyclopropane fatty-acyl-phospholipid synthase-like methyltransferase